jgi:hypothetical protein
MTLVADASLARRASIGVQSRYDRVFFGIMAIVLAVIVFAGFGPTYYFRFFSGGPQATVSGKPFSVLVHLHGALFDMVLFATFIVAALVSRRNKDSHKRLMLLAYAVLMTAAIGRIGGISAQGPLVFFGLSSLVVVCAALYDYFTRGRVHPVYIWGGALIFIMVPTRLAISGTNVWHSFAAFLVR